MASNRIEQASIRSRVLASLTFTRQKLCKRFSWLKKMPCSGQPTQVPLHAKNYDNIVKNFNANRSVCASETGLTTDMNFVKSLLNAALQIHSGDNTISLLGARRPGMCAYRATLRCTLRSAPAPHTVIHCTMRGENGGGDRNRCGRGDSVPEGRRHPHPDSGCESLSTHALLQAGEGTTRELYGTALDAPKAPRCQHSLRSPLLTKSGGVSRLCCGSFLEKTISVDLIPRHN